ncbi:diacylglycerol kinase family lipid kinase [Candidatus Aerophobetes bacterium]|uniref:Diacylglycerol kinase family lipid kinase n=1 Tax=Aerophobetes bacterium TaxID=2030807 RepID=A0A523UQR4_UNCAE|nr:MAG: diacylglycerol kinase family lipid kinase [Candidatus Aerophobetes bacterium]
MKTKLIVNLVAGRGKVKKLLPAVQRKLKEEGIEYDLVFSRDCGQAKIFAQQAKEAGYRRIIVCGGDGTVSEVINAIVKTDIALGIIPLGIGNDLARNLGIKKGIDFACHVLKHGEIKKIDVIKVGENKYYGGVGGIGFDAEVVSFVNRWKKFIPAMFIYPFYIGAIMMEIAVLRPQKVRIKYDENSFSGKVLMVCFGNTGSYARVIKISPFALVDDGLLDICIVKEIGELKIVILFFRSFIKALPFWLPEVKIYEEIPGVEVYQARKVYLESDTSLPFHGDAEIISRTPLCLEVVPEALKVIVPTISRGVLARPGIPLSV